MKRLLSWVGLILFLAAGQASANIQFSFSGVFFSDGEFMAGLFTTDDAITTLLDFDITTLPGLGVGHHYTTSTAISLSSLPSFLVVEATSLDNILTVVFSGGLHEFGDTLIDTVSSFEQGPDGRREIVTGSVIGRTVPEPATFGLLCIGVLGLLTFQRRRRRQR